MEAQAACHYSKPTAPRNTRKMKSLSCVFYYYPSKLSQLAQIFSFSFSSSNSPVFDYENEEDLVAASAALGISWFSSFS